ncbi:MAG TPA: DUF1289 domain-containing protein [Burkholderiaceae bacterium]
MKEFDPHAPLVGPVPSPCTSVCTMHPQSGLCNGCFRTLNEIAQWSTASEETKRAIWIALLERRDRSFD